MPSVLLLLPQVLDYDYYGAYSQERHKDYAYNQLLADEYTFDFPPHHDTVSVGVFFGGVSGAGGVGGTRARATLQPCRELVRFRGKESMGLPKTGQNVPKEMKQSACPMLGNLGTEAL